MKNKYSLFNCFRCLGLRLGWKYWKFIRQAAKDPKVYLDFAAALDQEAEIIKDISPEWAAFWRGESRRLFEAARKMRKI